MHFLLGFLLGYYTRNRPLLAATLLGCALVCFIVVPLIALSGLALSVRRERLSRPPQTRVPQLVGLDYKTAETTLHNSKLNIRVLAYRYDPPIEPGKIHFQTPQAEWSRVNGFYYNRKPSSLKYYDLDLQTFLRETFSDLKDLSEDRLKKKETEAQTA